MIVIPDAAWGGIAGATITAAVSSAIWLLSHYAALKDRRLEKIEKEVEQSATKEQAIGLAAGLKEHETRDNNLFESIRTHIEAVEVRLRGEVRDSKVDILTVLREPAPRTVAAARRRKPTTASRTSEEC